LIVSLLLMQACSPLPQTSDPDGQGMPPIKTEATDRVTPQVQRDVPPHVQRNYLQALEFMQAQQYHQAIKSLKTIVELNGQLSGPYINMGIAHMKLGDVAEAERAFAQALDIDPENPVVLNLLGMLQRKKGQFEDAEKFYQSALAAHPDYPYAHLNMGILCDLYIHKVDCALSHYQKYLQLSSGEDKQVSMWIADLKRRSQATAKRAGID